jgi:hypothetical protein
MNEMVERVAGVLFRRAAPFTKAVLFGGDNVTWEHVLEGIKSGDIAPNLSWLDDARAILDEMRMPTDAMIHAAWETDGSCYTCNRDVHAPADVVWEAMIDAAQSERR